ncbi:cytosine permease [Agromyces sp. NPDC058484]|uniref:cytosine permease n=1 Tax=Agromyces sp. NPDC058484 TaxID=3346524 RepID=UPI00364C7814
MVPPEEFEQAYYATFTREPCFISGGFVAAYLGATQGALAIIAGTLIGVFVVLLAALPAASRYGVEAVRSTRPIFGVRGSFLAVMLALVILVGWNAVLMISLAEAAAAALVQMGVIDAAQTSVWAVVFSLVGVVAVHFLLRRGNTTLRWAGPVVAITVLVLAVWIGVTIFAQFGVDEIFSAEALAPFPENRVNFMLVIELGVAGGMSRWPYVGGLTRNAKSIRHAALPSMAGLGLMMGLVLAIGMFAALALPASGGDPTAFLIEIGGPTVFSDLFMANYGAFITLAGILLGPICGIQIVDYFFIRRQELDVRGLFSNDSSGRYWYFAGFNPAGLVSLLVGMATYLVLLDPFTYVPGLDLGLIAASIPCAITAGVSYFVLMRVVPKLWASRLLPLASRRSQPRRVTDSEDAWIPSARVYASVDA